MADVERQEAQNGTIPEEDQIPLPVILQTVGELQVKVSFLTTKLQEANEVIRSLVEERKAAGVKKGKGGSPSGSKVKSGTPDG